MTPGRSARVVALLALGSGVVSCARQGAPPGGPEDRRPPVVISVEPDTFARVDPELDRLRIRFNERISRQATGGSLDQAVEISPEVPELEVKHDRQGLDIHIPGGLRPGLTYRVRITPAIRDMFGNPMAVPFEWMFSTGGEFTENAVVGQVWDRATGELLPDVRVVLQPREPSLDSLAFVSRSATEGLFALRSVPAGAFDVVAFQDRNGDRTLGETEAVGRADIPALGVADTVFLSVSLLVPDTTVAALVQTEVLDSTAVRVVFDDFVDPTRPLDGLETGLAPLPPDSAGVLPPQPDGALPEVARVFHEWEWDAYQDSIRAVADSLAILAADSAAAAADTVPAIPAVADTVAPGPPAREVEAGGVARVRRPAGGVRGPTPEPEVLPDGTPIPQPSVVLLLDGPLPPEITVEVRVQGITNLNGLEGGGGQRPVLWSPPAPDTIPPDTVPADSLPPDTARVGSDIRAERRVGRDVRGTLVRSAGSDAPGDPRLLPRLRVRPPPGPSS
jgi:hypothetical protein